MPTFWITKFKSVTLSLCSKTKGKNKKFKSVILRSKTFCKVYQKKKPFCKKKKIVGDIWLMIQCRKVKHGNKLREMLVSVLKILVNNPYKESFYGKWKKKVINILTVFFISHKSGIKTFLKWIIKKCP